jgi:hypothetical protein
MNTSPTSLRRLAAAGTAGSLGLALAALWAPAHAETAPLLPVPPQSQQVASMNASGVQVYSCEYGEGHRLGWVIKHPQATLYDGSGRASIRHGAGPSWEADDGSRIVGHVIAQAPAAAAESIAQLLLETKSVAGAGTLSEVRYVERLDTVGGMMPREACTAEHQTGSSPYLARYVFLK